MPFYFSLAGRPESGDVTQSSFPPRNLMFSNGVSFIPSSSLRPFVSRIILYRIGQCVN